MFSTFYKKAISLYSKLLRSIFTISLSLTLIASLCACKNNVSSNDTEPKLTSQSASESTSEVVSENVENDGESDEQNPIQDTDATSIDVDNSSKRVVCWGDSLTEGTGGGGVTMPNTLAKLSGANVINYGGYGETVSTIAARQGGNPQHLINETLIPAEPVQVPAQVEGKYGYEFLLNNSDAGINTVFLGGIEGTYSFDSDYNRCFTRLTPGDPVVLPSGAEFVTYAMRDKRPDDILVIWAGGNDCPQTAADIPPIIQKIDEMLAYQGCSQYIIISETNTHSRVPVTDQVNEAFAAKYGSHFLNLRKYLIENALDQLGITPTALDKKALSKGDIPSSLRMTDAEDEPHGNAYFYQIAGEQVYKKMRELGYLK